MTNNIRNYTGVGLVALNLAGCSFPELRPGEFRSSTLTGPLNFHPIAILVDLGKIEAEQNPKGINFTKYYWLLGQGASQSTPLPEGYSDLRMTTRVNPLEIIFGLNAFLQYEHNGVKVRDKYWMSNNAKSINHEGREFYDPKEKTWKRKLRKGNIVR